MSTTTSTTATRYTYGPGGENFGDLRLPAGGGRHPIVVYVHGGGYRAEVTLDGAAAMVGALTAHGYATWSIEYRRLGNGGGWPMTFDDVRAGAAHVRTLASQMPLDLERVFLAGQSAGGQLALWLATMAHRPDGHAVTEPALPNIRGVVALAPLTDMRGWATESPSGPCATLLGGLPDQVSERYSSTSPLELTPLGLRQLIVHGTADRTVPYAMSERYVNAARAAGDPVDLETVDGADHLDLWRPTSAAFQDVVERIVRTLDAWREQPA